jgi:cytidylate kinase
MTGCRSPAGYGIPVIRALSKYRRTWVSREGTPPLLMQVFPHIAIDGPVGSGKTTVAHEVARRLRVLYLDTGAMYRAVALIALRAGIDAANESALLALVRESPIHVTLDESVPLGFRVYSGEQELDEGLYDNEVSTLASVVAAYPGIREELVARQREIAASGPVVMAGRDIGTVVLPEAGLKIFLTASVEARVRRRAVELEKRGTHIDPVLLRTQVVERDRLDATRPIAPLRMAADAIEVDSSDMSIEEVVERITALAPLAKR